MQDINYVLEIDSHRQNRWERSAKTSDIFQTIPLSADEETEVHKVFQPRNTSTYQSPIQREEVRSPRKQVQDNTSVTKLGQDTLAKLERFRNVSNDKDKTVFQRTVVWIDNVQAKLPWWQKLLFGILTVGLILFITIYGFSIIWGFFTDVNNNTQNVSSKVEMVNMSGMSEDEAKDWFISHQLTTPKITFKQSTTNNQGKVIGQDPAVGTQIDSSYQPKITVGAGAPAGSLVVKNFRGMYQDKVQSFTEKELGYKVDVSNSRCYNQNTTGSSLSRGQILDQTPKAGENIAKGGTVYVWIYAPGSGGCTDLPPSLGGTAKKNDSKLIMSVSHIEKERLRKIDVA
jgi:hypothetical protein